VLFIASLNSGSNGNCYYVANNNEAVLVDVGLSCRETEKRMNRLGLKIEKVKAIFISHEHADHIRGVEVTSRKHKIPVYITKKTLNNSGLRIDEDLVRSFASLEPISVGGLVIKPFSKNHDAVDPFSFVVSGNNVNIGVFTDIGSSCEHLKKHFSTCHAAFLEANYDEDMLMNGHYPAYLKKRISGRDGHLSNMQALELFLKHKPHFMSLVLLSHLSKENNKPEIAHSLFSKHAGETEIVVASRYEESKLYTIKAGESAAISSQLSSEQLSLF